MAKTPVPFIMRPMLACKVLNVSQLSPTDFMVSTKMDGIRLLVFPTGQILTRRALPANQPSLQELMAPAKAYAKEHNLVLDGELWAPTESGTTFQDISSYLMTKSHIPVSNALTYDIDFWAFDAISLSDWNNPRPTMPAQQRYDLLNKYGLYGQVTSQFIHQSHREIQTHFEDIIEAGGEGLILKKLTGPYKHGRSTPKEQYLIKMKQFLSMEGTIAEVIEKQSLTPNAPQERNAFGLMKRGHRKGDRAAANTMGSLLLDLPYNQGQVSIGSGFTDAQRRQIWECRDRMIGGVVEFKYQPCGSKDAPRTPIFLRFRTDLC